MHEPGPVAEDADYSTAGSRPITPSRKITDMSVHWPILRRLLRNPRRDVIVDDKRTYSAGTVVGAALHLAGHLDGRCQSDTLGVLLPTSGGFPIAALAGWMLGKTIVPLNYLLKPDELQYVIDDCGTDTVVTVGQMLEFLDEPPKARHLIRLEEVSFTGIPDPRWPARARADDLAVLLYTSGTSGRPKGVMLTHGNLEANISQVIGWAGFHRDDVVLGVLPQFHSFGMTVLTLLPLTLGAKTIYTARFVPNKLIRLIRDHRPTVLVAIPSMYNALLRVKGATAEDFSSLRYLVSGGEPLPQAVFDGFEERFGIRITEGYGLTETSPCTNWCRPQEFVRHSVGRPLPGVHERIVDIETERDLPPNQEGEIRISGPNVMPGYFNLPEETRAAFDAKGYFRTGDIGKLDDLGNLFITGRLKEMMIIGGENVFPREIEEVLNKHPIIAESGVIGMEDPVRGEVPIAFVELIEEATFDETAILAHCREHLAGYKVPREVRALEALPRNPTGKILRRALKETHAG